MTNTTTGAEDLPSPPSRPGPDLGPMATQKQSRSSTRKNRSFLELLPVSTERVKRALDSVGYVLDEGGSQTVTSRHFTLRGSVQGEPIPVLQLRFLFRRTHPPAGYGALLSIANEVNQNQFAIKAHVAIRAQKSKTGQPAAFCLFFVEFEMPAGSGVADVQLYDVIVFVAARVESVIRDHPLLGSDEPKPTSEGY